MLDHIKQKQEEQRRRILKSFNTNQLEKGGEGSRGGKIIGHTKSGKPIYENSQHTSKDFTAEDHSDATSAHQRAAKEHSDKSSEKQKIVDKTGGYGAGMLANHEKHEHNRRSQHHSSMAALHQTAMNQKLDEKTKK